jgi:hypothetical protein
MGGEPMTCTCGLNRWCKHDAEDVSWFGPSGWFRNHPTDRSAPFCSQCGDRLNEDGTADPVLKALELACQYLANWTGECPLSRDEHIGPSEGRFSCDDCEKTCSERTGPVCTDFSACWRDWFLMEATE